MTEINLPKPGEYWLVVDKVEVMSGEDHAKQKVEKGWLNEREAKAWKEDGKMPYSPGRLTVHLKLLGTDRGEGKPFTFRTWWNNFTEAVRTNPATGAKYFSEFYLLLKSQGLLEYVDEQLVEAEAKGWTRDRGEFQATSSSLNGTRHIRWEAMEGLRFRSVVSHKLGKDGKTYLTLPAKSDPDLFVRLFPEGIEEHKNVVEHNKTVIHDMIVVPF